MKKNKSPKKKLEKILFVPDSHIPFQNVKAFELLNKVGNAFKPDHVIIQGDFLDFYDVSSHSKDPTRRFQLHDEINAGITELKKIKKWGAKNNVFIGGNHCNRLERYLQEKAPELYTIISIPKILKLDELGFHYVPYKSSYKLGKLHNTHDAGSAGRYAVHKSLDAFQSNVTIGHVHRISYIVEGNANGERHVAASFGWLGDIEHIDYMSKIKVVRDWSLGFGIGYLDTETGNVYLVPVPIIDNTCQIEGRMYSV